MGGPAIDPKAIDFVRRVRQKYKIDKAILFGSRARGDYLEKSDYDVLLVSDDFEGMHFSARMAAMYEHWKHYPTDIEAFCYTPSEFERKKREHGTVRSAVDEGIEIKA